MRDRFHGLSLRNGRANHDGLVTMGKDKRDPMAKMNAVQFHEELSSSWASAYRRGSFLRRLGIFRDLLDVAGVPGESWLDLGCGAGVLTAEMLARRLSVVALDGSQGMLDSAKSFCSDPEGRVEWRLGDVRDLGFLQDDSLDGIVCSSVVEYLPDAKSLFMEASRVLVSDADFIVSIPPSFSLVRMFQKFGEDWIWFLRFFYEWIPLRFAIGNLEEGCNGSA